MLTAKHKLEFKSGKRTARTIVEAGTHPEQPTASRLPRITKMMALAIRLDHLIKSRQVIDQAELARIGHVSRARLTQIMDLNLLAPDIQEHVLFLDSIEPHCRLPLEREVREIATLLNWAVQRSSWISYAELRNLRQSQVIAPNQPNRD
jgi:predicted XRE-type DNA-binding protein